MTTYEWANNPNKYFYHSDLDEIPDALSLAKALVELQTGTCDAVRGVWRDRATMDGSLRSKCTLPCCIRLQQ